MIVVDVETTGVDATLHSLVSIGAIDFENPKNTFYEECRIFEGAHVAKEALEVNGMTEEEIKLRSKPTDREVVIHFLEWLSKINEKTCAGQNPSFDLGFIQATARRYHLDFPLARRSVDLHSVAFAHMRSRGITIPLVHNHSSLSLDAILAYVGLHSEEKPHNGLRGALLEAECFSRLILNKSLLDEFKAVQLPWKA